MPVKFIIGLIALVVFGNIHPLRAEASAVSAQEPIVLLGGLLIDGNGGPPIQNSVVVIQSDRILYAGKRNKIEIPEPARIIPCKDLTILPGFINTHTHSLRIDRLQEWVQSGVTTVRNLASNLQFLQIHRTHYPPDPQYARLIASGPMIVCLGGYGAGEGNRLVVSSPEDARQKAEMLFGLGVDILKIAMDNNDPGPRWPTLPYDQVRMLVKVAHGYGSLVSAHLVTVDQLELALNAGVDEIAHIVNRSVVPQHLIDRMKAQNMVCTPTLHACVQAGWAIENALANLKLMAASGVKIAMGNDAADGQGYEFGMPMEELQYMLKGGMSPMQVIVAATKHAAEVCGLGHEIGTIESGKTADLFIVVGNPLDDLSRLLFVRMVIHYGVIVRGDVGQPGPEASEASMEGNMTPES